MSDLAEEVLETVEKTDPRASLWRKMVFIMAANALGTLVGGGLLGFCAIVWTKSNATDSLKQELADFREKSLTSDEAVLREIALIKATSKLQAEAPAVLPELPSPGTPALPVAPPVPSFKEVEAEKEAIQKQLDKAIYRQSQNR
jgi:hypothetical protein